MIENLPSYINYAFIITTLLTVYFFYKATGNSTTVLTIIICWLMMQGFIGYSAFYTITDSQPPRIILLAPPALLVIILLFILPKGKMFIHSLDMKFLTYLHLVRIPVEICLWWLFTEGKLPQLMTFEGRNFDIISGITAPVVAYWGLEKNFFGKKIILIWNFICLGLLINIVTNAVLSVPSVFQQFGFEQPNIAVLYFPFVWLPCFIVPAVLLAHLTVIKRLLQPS